MPYSLWRSVLANGILLLFVALLTNVASGFFAQLPMAIWYHHLLKYGIAILFSLIGIWLIRRIGPHDMFRAQHGPGTGGTARAIEQRPLLIAARIIRFIGYTIVLLVALNTFSIDVRSLLVGGALTGVILGIAAQSTLSNLFAGLLLLTLRPFSVGQQISFRSSFFSSVEYTGVVVDMNWYYTVIKDNGREVKLPNAAVIVSAVIVHHGQENQKFTFSVPLTLPLDSLAEAIKTIAGHELPMRITEFSSSGYSVEVTCPADVRPDLLRSALLEATSALPKES
ncbi:mechanosensitive ion channel family protein [Ferroacidibacillus organovorans]|uniref:Mechanosensitive ion channel MscS domain-containing protein n=1 Tax=Ferroacidibacillus organovorans TaxID=1765683 RepID=A0A162TCY8_9BACL|nr:mechanosensitive ion channel domain-containing protein [Ferroacidibacillus organovorans]KYP80679.1 hypothetical protein AYJ22_10300 [Ferroacidibacillus organovorans]OAG93278.1 hypothetical protein AYW79_11455 [Ferroacidibacillus organovorans]OPG15921.1 hypothetical protein B2M26_10010 [Ferroacidibacillus organovorans]